MLADRSSRTTTSRVPPAAATGRAARRQERPREREGDQREREDAQREQRPVPDRAAPHRLVRDPPQEHQRRERLRPSAARAARGARRSESRWRAGRRAGRGPGTTSAGPAQALARRQVVEQRVVERHRGVEQRVVDPAVGEEPAERLGVLRGPAPGTARAPTPGTTGIRSPVSRSSKLAASVNGKSSSAGIEHVEHDDVVARGSAAAAPRSRRPRARRRGPRSRRRCRGGRRRSVSRAQRRRRARPGRPSADPVERVEAELEMPRRRRHVLDDLRVEGDQAHAVALLVREVQQRRGQEAAVVELA